MHVKLYMFRIFTIRVEGFEILLFHHRVNVLDAFHVSLHHLTYFRSPTIYGKYRPIKVLCDEINSFRKQNLLFLNKLKEFERKIY